MESYLIYTPLIISTCPTVFFIHLMYIKKYGDDLSLVISDVMSINSERVAVLPEKFIMLQTLNLALASNCAVSKVLPYNSSEPQKVAPHFHQT